jgi:hypothetical protein
LGTNQLIDAQTRVNGVSGHQNISAPSQVIWKFALNPVNRTTPVRFRRL